MEVKKFLNNLIKIDQEIKFLSERIEEARTSAESCTVALSERVQSSSSTDMSSIIVQINKLEDKLSELMSQKLKMQIKVIDAISQMSNQTYAEIINRRYLKNENLVSIAYHMNYSYSHIKHLHGKALLEFRKVMQKIQMQTSQIQ